MKQLTQDEAQSICQRVLKYSTADDCSVSIAGNRNGNIRFARNAVSTAGLTEDRRLTVQVAFGKRQGTANVNEFDDKSLERAVRRAEDVARLAPENPEYVGIPGKQDFKPSEEYFASTAAIDPDFRAEVAAHAIEAGRKNKLVTAGFFNDATGFETIANSKRFASTAREAIEVAIEKAMKSVDAKAIEPGRYTVILEPAATSELVGRMFGAFDARNADEGRSFLAKKGGANRLGEQLFDPRVNVWADPWDKDVPVSPWDSQSMLARRRQDLIKDGKVASLDYSRFWAQKKGVQPNARPGNIIMAGGSKSLEELIQDTKKGVLVTRTWYIRQVDPQSLLLTGLTRDGTFYIENGKIKYPIKNFRFNESPVTMLNNVEELGKPVVVAPDEVRFQMMIPPMRLRDFNFTSLSDAV
jgi:predicted Zn-dependent protease